MKPKVITAQSIDELGARCQEANLPAGAYTLAIVFASASHDLPGLQALLAGLGLDIFAASSAGEIAGDRVLEESITMMLLDVDRSGYRLKSFRLEHDGPFHLGRMVAAWAKEVFAKPALMIMASGHTMDGDLLVNGIAEQMGDQPPLFGGFASFDPAALPMDTATLVLDTTRAVSEGLVALAFDGDKIALKGIAASGWKGVGTTKTVTKASGNVVHEIDGQPAHALINRYLEIGVNADLAVEYPLCWLRGDGSTVLRAIAGFNEDGSVVYAGTVPQGAKVRFGIPPGLEVIDEAVEQMEMLKAFASSGDAVILFSCRARHTALGPMVEDEVAAIDELWDAPQIGFFTFGEIGPGMQGRCDFHNHTIVAVLVSEKTGRGGDAP